MAKNSNSLCWKDDAVGGGTKLKDLYPRLFALEKNKEAFLKIGGFLVTGHGLVCGIGIVKLEEGRLATFRSCLTGCQKSLS